ncbi:hypothetical protein [Aquimarina hainanensis]
MEIYRYNYLLDLRTADFLTNMNFKDRFALLHELLRISAQPITRRWRYIFEFFDSLKDSEQEKIFFEITCKEIDHWDEAVLSMHSNSKYVLDQKCEGMFSRLIKHVSIYKRESKGNEHLIKIAHNENLENLNMLTIHDSTLNKSGILALKNSSVLKNIHSLRIQNVVLNPALRALLYSCSFPNLKHLELIKLGISDSDYSLLEQASIFEGVQSLNLSSNILADGFITTLFDTMTSLPETIILKRNFIKEAGMNHMLGYLKNTSFQLVDVSKNSIPQDFKSKDTEVLRGTILY